MHDLIPDFEPWFDTGLSLGESHIHGQGVFATRNFRPGEAVIRLGGSLYPIKDRRSELVLASTAIPVSDCVVLAEPASGKRDLSDFLNHSCSPNLGLRDALTIFVIKPIQIDEELVIDYAYWECDPQWQLKDACNCRSPRCRGFVTGSDSLKISPTSIQFSYLSPFLRRRLFTSWAKKEKL